MAENEMFARYRRDPSYKPERITRYVAGGFLTLCCAQAQMLRTAHCVCKAVTECPVHGVQHHGTHD